MIDVPKIIDFSRENLQTQSFFLIAGPCVIESEDMALSSAQTLSDICNRLSVPFIYKSSFDKANRTASDSPRGPGRDEGLKILQKVREQLNVPVLTDVHSVEDVKAASEVVDVLQTPAFLCRQTDLIEAVATSGKPANIKKGQFLSPDEMQNVVDKARHVNKSTQVMVCERGTSFGYNNLVVDMRSLEILKRTYCPVVFDATHSVQLPGAGGRKSSGQREFVPVLAKAAMSLGIDGIFMESHPNPAEAHSDGPNSWPLAEMEGLLSTLLKVDAVAKSRSLSDLD